MVGSFLEASYVGAGSANQPHRLGERPHDLDSGPEVQAVGAWKPAARPPRGPPGAGGGEAGLPVRQPDGQLQEPTPTARLDSQKPLPLCAFD